MSRDHKIMKIQRACDVIVAEVDALDRINEEHVELFRALRTSADNYDPVSETETVWDLIELVGDCADQVLGRRKEKE